MNKTWMPDHLSLPILAAFATVYFVWGSTFLANYWAIQGIPSFMMSGGRFVVAGTLLFAFAFRQTRKWPSALHWCNSWILGTLFLAIGSGGVVWSEQFIPSGIASLLVALEPLVILFFMWILLGRKPSWKSLLGIMLGFVGVCLLVGQPKFSGHEKTIWGLVAIAISITSWAYASVALPAYRMPTSRLMGTAMQMLGGGSSLFIFSAIAGEYHLLEWTAINTNIVLSWLYLIVFGSLIAFSCFNYLLHKVSADQVATMNYVNPLVALWLGWMLNNEELTNQSMLAAVVMLTGVVLIIQKRSLN